MFDELNEIHTTYSKFNNYQNTHLMIPHCHHSKEEAALTGAFGIEEVGDSEEGGYLSDLVVH